MSGANESVRKPLAAPDEVGAVWRRPEMSESDEGAMPNRRTLAAPDEVGAICKHLKLW